MIIAGKYSKNSQKTCFIEGEKNMITFNKKDISVMIESLNNGRRLAFQLHETFGGGVSLVELNPLYPGKKQKKYTIRLGKDVELAQSAAPFWSSDKLKDVSAWVSDRAIKVIEEPPSS
jgi:hypothetical protein